MDKFRDLFKESQRWGIDFGSSGYLSTDGQRVILADDMHLLSLNNLHRLWKPEVKKYFKQELKDFLNDAYKSSKNEKEFQQKVMLNFK